MKNPFDTWPRMAWGGSIALVVVAAVLGFVVLGGEQQDAKRLGIWASICRSLGINSGSGPAAEPQPALVTSTHVAWTHETLVRIDAGSAQRGEALAAGCVGCHGPGGVSVIPQYPTIAGLDAKVIYKQLDDFRSGKRPSPIMTAFAAALTPEQSADVAAWFASRKGGLEPIVLERFQGGRTLRESDPATRLVFAGDPSRGIPPCAACHGPGDTKIGAPALRGQHPDYIELQLTAFAQGTRANDISRQMRTVATELTPQEVKALASFYGAAPPAHVAAK
jgi:cytochrome c553